jgi:hypothetical protein
VSDLRALDVGDPHPFVGGRIKVDVVDPDSELLDEAEHPGQDGPPRQGRPQRDDDVHVRPTIDQALFELALADDLDHDSARKAGKPVLRHLRPSVVLGEPLLSGKHLQCPVVELVSRGGHGDTGTIAGQIGAR